VYKEWENEGRPSEFNATNYFYVGYTTNQVFFFTNRITIEGTEYHCRFALRSDRFEMPGFIVLTDEGVLLWLGDNGKTFVSPDKGGFSNRRVK